MGMANSSDHSSGMLAPRTTPTVVEICHVTHRGMAEPEVEGSARSPVLDGVCEADRGHGEGLVGDQVPAEETIGKGQVAEMWRQRSAVHHHPGVDHQGRCDDHDQGSIPADQVDHGQLRCPGKHDRRHGDCRDRVETGLHRRHPVDQSEGDDPDEDRRDCGHAFPEEGGRFRLAGHVRIRVPDRRTLGRRRRTEWSRRRERGTLKAWDGASDSHCGSAAAPRCSSRSSPWVSWCCSGTPPRR